MITCLEVKWDFLKFYFPGGSKFKFFLDRTENSEVFDGHNWEQTKKDFFQVQTVDVTDCFKK